MKRLLLCAAMALFTTSALAWTSLGYVKRMIFMNYHTSDVVFFSAGSRIGAAPACATAPDQWVINIGTTAGKAQLDGILAAYARGTQVRVVGLGTCDVYPGVETVYYFYTTEP